MDMLRCTEAGAFVAYRSRHIESKKAPPISGLQRPVVRLSSDGQMGGVVMSKRIPLSQGKFAVVDDADFEWLSQWKWYAARCRRIYYARRGVWENGKMKGIQMHQLITNPPLGMEPDHINGDGLDNRRCNLRLCTRSQNRQNSKKRLGCSSRYRGVSWQKRAGKWESYIMINGRQKHLGSFVDEHEAAAAYNTRATALFGDFARLNVLQED